MQTDPGMNGPVVPFLLTCHAMHRASSRQRASNTQHDDSAIDYLRFHGLPTQGNTLLLRMMIYSTWKIEHVLSKGVHATEVSEIGFG